MKRNSSIEQHSSQLLKINQSQTPPENKKSSSLKARSVSPPPSLPPIMPPKPSPKTIQKALAVDNSIKKHKDKAALSKEHLQQIQSQKIDPSPVEKTSTIKGKRQVTKKKALPPLPKTPSSISTIEPPEVLDSSMESDELLDLNTDSSDQHVNFSETEVDENLIKQVQKVHLNYIKREHMKNKGLTQDVKNLVQGNITDKDSSYSSERFKKLPPPPPPNKKYNNQSDNELQTTTLAAPLMKPPETPPSVVNIPLLVNGQEVDAAVEAISVHSSLTAPQPPPRPSRSTLARAHTIASKPRRILRSVSPEFDFYDGDNEERPSLARTATKIGKHTVMSRIDLMTNSIYPDFTQATRNPPLNILEKPFLTGHRGALTGLVASRNRLITCAGTIRTWDIKKNTLVNMITIDHNNMNSSNNTAQLSPEVSTRIRTVVIAPTRNPKDEGRYIWVARHELCVLDLQSPNNNKVISKRSDAHTSHITFLLRNGNTEIWSIDYEGMLNIWDVLSLDPSDPLTKVKPRQHKVTAQAVAAIICDYQLWISSGRDLVVHFIADTDGRKSPLSTRVPNDMGEITNLVTIPIHPHRLFASHSDGKISVWDTEALVRLQVITVSMYSISTMTSVGEYYVWAGYSTGMIYVYDTRPEKWVVLKMWKAHSAAVTQLHVDETSLLLDENRGRLQVVSGDSYGSVGVWDGLLTEYWKDKHVQARESEFCSYNNVKAMVCSWNIDATKPEEITGEDERYVREWLSAMNDPDIIVVGIQEIVDLVSKKQTARSLFFNRKTDLTEKEEIRTNRYRLWLDYLVKTVTSIYGKGTFTVAKTEELVGLFSCVFVRTSDLDRIFDIDSTSVKTGLKVMNKSLHGNKGGIAIRFVYDHSSLCFVNCHLAAGQSHTQQRNADIEGILQSANFPHRNYADVFYHGGDGAMILDHEFCFLSGDLNYRINMNRSEVLKTLTDTNKKAAWKKLQDQDQLIRQKVNNPLFKLLTFEEAAIHFDPTYKYENGTDFYDSSEKRRIPAWCDRILFKGRQIESLFYRRFEAKCSDHRPIAAGFSFQTKITEQKKREIVATSINEEWRNYIDQFVKNRKAKYVSQYKKCTVRQALELLEKENYSVTLTVENLMNKHG